MIYLCSSVTWSDPTAARQHRAEPVITSRTNSSSSLTDLRGAADAGHVAYGNAALITEGK